MLPVGILIMRCGVNVIDYWTKNAECLKKSFFLRKVVDRRYYI